MAAQGNEAKARVYDETLGRLPPTWVLLVTLIGGSGVFSGAWWLGLDTRPDPWTATQAREVNSAQDRKVSEIRADLEEAERHLWTLQIQHSELIKRYERLERSVHRHHERSEKWIAIIERNTTIILENQEKAHTHNGNSQR